MTLVRHKSSPRRGPRTYTGGLAKLGILRCTSKHAAACDCDCTREECALKTATSQKRIYVSERPRTYRVTTDYTGKKPKNGYYGMSGSVVPRKTAEKTDNEKDLLKKKASEAARRCEGTDKAEGCLPLLYYKWCKWSRSRSKWEKYRETQEEAKREDKTGDWRYRCTDSETDEIPGDSPG